jgi:hypothetical protein
MSRLFSSKLSNANMITRIETLLEEAWNERMHLLTFVSAILSPLWFYKLNIV